MKRIAKIVSASLLSACLFVMLFGAPLAAHATTFPYWGGTFPGTDPLISCTAAGNAPLPGSGNTLVPDPLNRPQCVSLCDIFATLQNIIFFALTIMVFIIIPLMVAVGGVMIMISGGNPNLRKTGIGYVKDAAIGAAIGLASFVLVNTLLWAVGNAAVDTSGHAAADTVAGVERAHISWADIKCQVADYADPNTPAKGRCGGTQSGDCYDGNGKIDPTQTCTKDHDSYVCVASTRNVACQGSTLGKCADETKQACIQGSDGNYSCVNISTNLDAKDAAYCNTTGSSVNSTCSYVSKSYNPSRFKGVSASCSGTAGAFYCNEAALHGVSGTTLSSCYYQLVCPKKQ